MALTKEDYKEVDVLETEAIERECFVDFIHRTTEYDLDDIINFTDDIFDNQKTFTENNKIFIAWIQS